jgi:hypothetical protein
MKYGLPRLYSYGEYSSSNYGAHCLAVEFGPVTVWFSYRTPVAFHVEGHKRVVHENDWSTTTGKHLKWIDGYTTKEARRYGARVDDETFKRLWNEQVEPLFASKDEQPAPEESILEGLGRLLPEPALG